MSQKIEADAVTEAETLPETKTITLRKPVTFATLEYAQITLREPTAGEWEAWDDLTGVAANRKAIATVAGIPEGAVKQFGVRDFNEAMRYLNAFF